MKQHLVLVPFYAVGRMVEIDFRELKRCLNDRMEGYKDGIIKWAYSTMLKNV